MIFDKEIEEFILNEDSSFEKLLAVLHRGINVSFGSGLAIIVNSVGEITGIIQDSDLRKFLFKYPEKSLNIKDIMNTNFIALNDNLSEQQMIQSLISQMDLRGWSTNLPVKIIPVLRNRRPIGLINSEEIQLVLNLHKSNYIVIGLGYIGLTLALSLANLGRKVFGFDTDSNRVDQLNQFKPYILEPGIDTLLKTHLNQNFHAKDNLHLVDKSPGVQNIYFICVGSPLNLESKPNLQPIWNVLEELVVILKKGDAIVMRSTVPVGFGNEVIGFINSKLNWTVGVDFHYIAAPERTIEGNALKEIRELPQVLSGATMSCQMLGQNIFKGISNSATYIDKIEGAELVKIIGNAYRDYVFGFSNYFIDICQRFELDINQIIEASNRGYARSSIPSPSIGVGGPCLSKDTYFLNAIENSQEFSPLIAARKINELIPSKSVSFIQRNIPNLSKFRCLGIGIAFKGIPETNDLRNSPSIDFLDMFKEVVNSVSVWDSAVTKNILDEYFEQEWYSTDYDIFAILNNNPKNLAYFNDKISNCKAIEVIVFDPWRLAVPSQILCSASVKILHYFSLSHYEMMFLHATE